MTKNEFKDLLFDILNEQDSLFYDVELDESLDSIIVRVIDNDEFIIHTDSLLKDDREIRRFIKDFPLLCFMEMAVIKLYQYRFIDEQEKERLMCEIASHAKELNEEKIKRE